MAVIEYMMHRYEGGTRRRVPEWVGDRGHWMSPIDGSFIGWVDDSRDYYVPDTVVSLTKEDFVQRQLTIHATQPFTNPSSDDLAADPVTLTVDEVRTTSEEWYDAFVTKNSGA